MNVINTDLISLLKYFNRTERFFLVGQVLGNKDFTISEDFRNEISKKLNIEIPPDALQRWIIIWIDLSKPCQHIFNVQIKDIWFQLNIPDYLLKIALCNETGKASILGRKWKVERT